MSATARLPERYRALELLGEGGGGRVWLVEDRRRPGTRLALKELAGRGRSRERSLLLEFATLSALRHPNLVEVHEVEPSPAGGPPFFTLEYVEGDGIVAAVRREGATLLPVLAAEALRALAFLHDFDVVHRDLKPANLLVRERPRLGCRLVVLDFGLAVREPDLARSAVGSAAAGTLPYLAPELLRGDRPGPRSDLYALGAVLFEALHGRQPYELDPADLAGFVDAVARGRRPRLAAPPGFPPELPGWLDELLDPDPDRRPPSAREALARLNDACGTQHPIDTPPDRAARLASGVPPGRQREIDELWTHLTPDGGPRLVWLCGGPGSGKRRLLRWMSGEAVVRGWDVSWGPAALGPDEDRTSDGPGAVERALAELRRRAAERPTLVLLPRLEAGGSRLIEFVERVARERREEPLRVVAALRPGESTNPALSRLLGQTAVIPTLRRVDLGPLGAEALAALVERATGSRSASPARISWLADASEGNPARAGALLVGGAWEHPARAEAAGPQQGPAEPRLALLSPPALALARALAVVGAEVHESDAVAIARIRPGQIRDAFAELTALALAREDGGLWSIETRTLGAELRDLMDAAERRRLFARAAREIERSRAEPGARTFLLARLWSGAGRSARAARLAREAAERAGELGDPVQAAERFAFALAHTPRRATGRLELRIRQAEALRAANLPQPAARALGAALRLARGRHRRADLLARQAEMLVQAGRFERARAAAEEAHALAEAEGLLAVRARARLALGTVLARQGGGSRALPYLRDAVAGFAGAGERMAEAQALQALALCEANEGLPEARGDFERAIELFRAAGARGKGLINHVGLAVIQQRAGNLDAAREMLQQTRKIAVEHHNLLIEGVACGTLAHTCVLQDRLGDALSLAREAEDQGQRLGDERLIFAARGAQAQALARCGRPAEAAALLETTLEAPHDKVDPVMVEYARLALAEALLARQPVDEPRLRVTSRACLDATRRLRDPDTLLWSLVVELERRSRHAAGEDPAPIHAELDELFARGGSWNQPYFRARAGQAAAARLLAGEHAREASAAARAAATLAAEHGFASLAARATFLQAAALESLGDDDGAAAGFAAARVWADETADRVGDLELRRGLLSQPVFRELLSHGAAAAATRDRRLGALYEMIRALNSQRDPDTLLESILDMAIRGVGADRGLLLLRETDGGFRVALARDVEQETARDAEGYSHRIVAEAGRGRSVLAADAACDERLLDATSVSLYGIVSLICVPLHSRGNLIGTVYLDKRNAPPLFDAGDLRFLEAFADHAALALDNAGIRQRLERDNRRLQARAESRVRFGRLIGRSPVMQRVFDVIEKAAASDLPVLIQGASGTGKELVARAIHFNGPRARGAFVTENCSAIPDTLLQSELFGHVRGAFTGAERDHAGLFEQADGGTMFLDEVGDMSASMQAQLLRVLQEREVRRIGGDRPIRVDVRLLAATHHDLQHEAEDGRFREDLFYRLQVVAIHLPALDQRREDIALLVDYFMERIAAARGRPRPSIDPEVARLIERHPWPGNVRQLESCLQRLCLHAGDGPITARLLDKDPALRQMLDTGATPAPKRTVSLRQSERERIRAALHAAAGNRSRAAKLLGIGRATIYRKIKEHRL